MCPLPMGTCVRDTHRNWSSGRSNSVRAGGPVRAIFIDACLQVGVRSTTSGLTVYVSRKDHVKLLDAHGCAKG